MYFIEYIIIFVLFCISQACNDRNSSTFNMDMEPCNLRAEIWEDPNMQQFMKKVVEDVDCVIREGM